MIESVNDIKGMFFCLHHTDTGTFSTYKIVDINLDNYRLLAVCINPEDGIYNDPHRVDFIERDIAKVHIFPSPEQALEFCQFIQKEHEKEENESKAQKKADIADLVRALRSI